MCSRFSNLHLPWAGSSREPANGAFRHLAGGPLITEDRESGARLRQVSEGRPALDQHSSTARVHLGKCLPSKVVSYPGWEVSFLLLCIP